MGGTYLGLLVLNVVERIDDLGALRAGGSLREVGDLQFAVSQFEGYESGCHHRRLR